MCPAIRGTLVPHSLEQIMALQMGRERLDRLVPRHSGSTKVECQASRAAGQGAAEDCGPGICAFAPTCPRDLLDTVEDAILALRGRLMSRLSCL